MIELWVLCIVWVLCFCFNTVYLLITYNIPENELITTVLTALITAPMTACFIIIMLMVDLIRRYVP